MMKTTARARLLRTWLALLLLLAASAGSAWLPIGPALLPVSVLIALAKAALIGWVFMDLRERQPLLRLAAAVGLLALLLLGTLSLVDLAVRRDEPVPWQEPAVLARPDFSASMPH